ncbi:glycoside hydrolase family 3 protein [Zeaxanthinibacter sp. PT1]|uniref:glycoside hydrolase family 3 protein n=1 Tax=Zeaxanthinibacter TaxID=561554 RepID=UPI00234C0052|nr:glycoside hydrolase family 3 protein [Zeaxanthinibacter sp. PT1]MDC6352188.1 glycoside hydrolase family 3 protein [Zeaxanthinibacter sp. PT1]
MSYTLPPISTLSTEQKVGQLFMPAAFINDSEEEIQKLEALIQNRQIGGICFFHSRASAATNFEGAKKIDYNKDSLTVLRQLILRYQAAASIPLLISIDAEWGLAMRIEDTPQYPYAITLGAIQDNEELVFRTGKAIGQDCIKQGIHWNFAPVADVNCNPDNPVIGYRSFGEAAELVARKSTAFMKGMQAGGVLTSAKHFPGHGDTATDSHLGLPLISADRALLDERELVPFRSQIAAGVDSVMVGHLSVPALDPGENMPATISPLIIKEVLRGELGFQGVVVSDALNMHAVSRLYPEKGALEFAAFSAGNDVLCFTEHVEEGIEMILKKGSEAAINDAFSRVWKLKAKATARQPESFVEPADPANLNRELAAASLTSLFEAPGLRNELTQHGYECLSISKNSDSAFFREIGVKAEGITYLHPSDQQFEVNFDNSSKFLVIALNPPKVKPADNFDFSNEILQLLNGLIRKRNVILYLFGNPYMLDLLDISSARAVVVAYQDLLPFQVYAARYFLGEAQAPGILPVTLKNDLNEKL